MKIFDIYSDMGHIFEFENIIYPNYKGIIIPHAAIHSLHGGYGDFIFQQTARPLFDAWYSNYLTKQRCKTHSRADVSLIELSIVIKNGVSYHFANPIGRVHQKGGQFNIFNSLAMDSKVQFEKSALYTTLDIHAKPGLLAHLYAKYPDLMDPLMNAIAAQRDYMFFKRPLYLTYEMKELVDYILVLLRQPTLDVDRLDRAVITLFTYAIIQKTETTSKKYSHERLRELEIQLSDLLQMLRTDRYFRSVAFYASSVSMSVSTLNRNFYNLYGCPIKRYWRDHHMEKPYHDVLFTSKSFTEIAFENGFADVASFSKAFKRIYQYPPSYFRKGNING